MDSTEDELKSLARKYVAEYGTVARALDEMCRRPSLCKLELSPVTDQFQFSIDINCILDTSNQLDIAICFISGDSALSDGFSDYSSASCEDTSIFAEPEEAIQCIKSVLSTSSGCFEAVESIHWDALLRILSSQPFTDDLQSILENLFNTAVSYSSSDQAFQIGCIVIKGFINTGTGGEITSKIISSLARVAVTTRRDLVASTGALILSGLSIPDRFECLNSPLQAWRARKSVADLIK